MYAFKAPDKQRPVVILSRQSVLPLLRTVLVAPITSTIHGVPSEVVLGAEHGLKHRSAANLDHVQTVAQSKLKRFLGHLDEETMAAALFESLLINYPFIDGNKRVAFFATDVFLRLNGWRMNVEANEAHEFILSLLGEERYSVEDLAGWVRRSATKLDG